MDIDWLDDTMFTGSEWGFRGGGLSLCQWKMPNVFLHLDNQKLNPKSHKNQDGDDDVTVSNVKPQSSSDALINSERHIKMWRSELICSLASA